MGAWVSLKDGVIPLGWDWIALKQIPEEQCQAPEGDDHDASPDKVPVPFLGSESQKEDAYRQLNKHHVKDICCGGEGLELESCNFAWLVEGSVVSTQAREVSGQNEGA